LLVVSEDDPPLSNFPSPRIESLLLVCGRFPVPLNTLAYRLLFQIGPFRQLFPFSSGPAGLALFDFSSDLSGGCSGFLFPVEPSDKKILARSVSTSPFCSSCGGERLCRPEPSCFLWRCPSGSEHARTRYRLSFLTRGRDFVSPSLLIPPFSPPPQGRFIFLFAAGPLFTRPVGRRPSFPLFFYEFLNVGEVLSSFGRLTYRELR